MELEINIESCLRVKDGYINFTGNEYLKQTLPEKRDLGLKILTKIIDSLGERSAKSQGLKQIITTSTKFFGSEQRIYLKVIENKAVGFVKVG
jgi:hypothetical protein